MKRAGVLLLLFGLAAAAQDNNLFRQMITRLAAGQMEVDDFAQNYVLLKAVRQAGEKSFEELLAFRRTDIQAGASSGASGSTSAVLNPLLPAIFGFSFENGALTRSVSGSTLTIKLNPTALLCAAGSNSAAVARRSDDTCRTVWKRLGVTAAFDTSRGEKKQQLEDLETLNNQFTELGVRFEVLNQRKLTGPAYERRFGNVAAFNQKAQELVQTIRRLPPTIWTEQSVAVANALNTLMASDAWRTMDAAGRGKAITTELEKIKLDSPLDAATAATLHDNWLDALRAFRSQQDAVLNAPVLTAEYSYQKPDLATAATANALVPAGIRPPNLHSVRLIYAQGVQDKSLDLTANLSASWFGETRPGMSGSFRDLRAGAQVIFRLREIQGYGVPTLTFAGLYTYLHQRPLGLGLVAFNQTKIDEKGNIGLFQAKFEFPTGKNAVRIPASFTYSNRTELIKESEARGQIGISFNLDSLFAQN